MPRDLGNSLPLDESLWFDSPGVREFAHEFARSIYKRIPGGAEGQILVLLTNLHYCTRDDEERVLALSMDHRDYAASAMPRRYNPAGLSKSLIFIVHRMRDLGWIGYTSGFRAVDGFSRGRLTRIWPKARLVRCLKQFDFPVSRPRHPFAEVIELRGSKQRKGTRGELLDYVETASTQQMRRNLIDYNDWLAQQWIDLRVTESELIEINKQLKKDPDRHAFDASRIALKRIFNNGNFDEGGRFYGGWWMEIPNRVGSWRRDITINGGSTVELDFSGLHFAMLYAMENSRCPDDPYYHPELGQIPNGRKYLKTTLNAILNASTEHEVLGVMHREAQSFGLALPMPPAQLLGDLKSYHEPIANYFHTGEGLKLQRHDSHIMSNLLNWLRKVALVGLPIHDSVIVELTYAEYVAQRMCDEFYRVFKEEIELNNNIEIHFKPGCTWEKFRLDNVDPEWRQTELNRSVKKPNHGYRVRSQYRELWALEAVGPDDPHVRHDVCVAKHAEIKARIRDQIAPRPGVTLSDLLKN